MSGHKPIGNVIQLANPFRDAFPISGSLGLRKEPSSKPFRIRGLKKRRSVSQYCHSFWWRGVYLSGNKPIGNVIQLANPFRDAFPISGSLGLREEPSRSLS